MKPTVSIYSNGLAFVVADMRLFDNIFKEWKQAIDPHARTFGSGRPPAFN